MAYRFELDESLAEGVRRIGCEQIDEAIQQLSKNGDPHKGIHEARKSLKRLRALLRLARPALRKRDYKSEYRSFRDIGRELSKARDAQAMYEAVSKLNDTTDATAKAGAEQVTQWITRRRGEALRGLDDGPKDLLVGALKDARRRFGQLRIKGGFPHIGKGLQQSYRDGRRAFAVAYGRGHDEDFHNWRKGVQQHWRHMQLLQEAWPETLSPRIELTKELSQMLGDDQDITLLRGQIEGADDELAGKLEVDAFLSACRDKQRRLRADAEPRGQRLFVERPKAFRERMTACWETARKLARQGDDDGPDKSAPGPTKKQTEPQPTASAIRETASTPEPAKAKPAAKAQTTAPAPAAKPEPAQAAKAKPPAPKPQPAKPEPAAAPLPARGEKTEDAKEAVQAAGDGQPAKPRQANGSGGARRQS